MLRAALLTLASAVAVPATLALPAGPAAAAHPTENTTYRDASIDAADDAGSITITIGPHTHRIAKLVVVADCGGSKERFTRRNVPIRDDDTFRVTGGRYVSVVGTFRTAHRVTGSLTTNQCGFFGGDFAATD